MTIKPLTKLELRLLDLISELEDDNDRARVAASIVLELAREAYDQGRIDQCNYECGRGNGSFKQFIQDYQ